jgi:excisionase family DNA binding protein
MRNHSVPRTRKPESPAMKIEQVAEFLRCDPITIYRLIRRGGFPARKLGKNWRFFRSEIDVWLDRRVGNPARRHRRVDAAETQAKIRKGRNSSITRGPSLRNGREVMTLAEVFGCLHCHRCTMLRWVYMGKIRAFRLIREWRFHRSDVEKWIAERDRWLGTRRSRSPSPRCQ